MKPPVGKSAPDNNTVMVCIASAQGGARLEGVALLEEEGHCGSGLGDPPSCLRISSMFLASFR